MLKANLLLKVCGMREHDNILQLAQYRPDFLGFIFYKPSPRYVGDDFTVPQMLPGFINKVGVFVNERPETIITIAEKQQLQYVQLHGNESPESCLKIKSVGVGVIKVFSVDSNFDFRLTQPYEQVVNYFLFDTKGKYPGGNATTFDWVLLNNYNQKIPFFLSGGLNEVNLTKITEQKNWNIIGLDVNSGVEEKPGVKNIEKVKNIITVIRK